MDRLRSIPLTSGRHDRAAVRRRDENWLRQVVRKGPLRIIAVRSHSDLLVADGSRLASLDAASLAQDAELTFLGVDLEGAAIFVCDADACELAAELLEAHAFHELRAIGGALTPDDAALAVQAVALVGWHRRHHFCGVCGAATVPEEAGHSRRCTGCGTQHFPRTDPAVIMLVSAGDRCVLSRRSGSAVNRWTVLSGFVEPGETPEEAVAREVYEEVGLKVTEVHYLGSQPWPFPASLMLGYAAEAEFSELVVDEELEDARWFTHADIRQGIEDGSLAFPPSVSISRQLIMGWLEGGMSS